MKNRTSRFLELMENFISRYLPIAAGASPNTVKSYKYAFRLLLEYLYTQRGIAADNVSFSQLDYDCITGFLEWLEEVRNCSVSTKNQRLSALLSFSEYAQNREFEAASVFRSNLLKIPMKKGKKQQRTIFTVREVTVLLQIPDERKRTGLRDKVLLSLMYASGARAQEMCDLTIRDIVFSSNGIAAIILTGKGGKTRRIGIPATCSKMLRQYIRYRQIDGYPERHVFSSQTHEQMTVSCIEGIFKKYVNLARSKYPEMFRAKSYPPHAMRHTTASHMLESGVPLIVIKNFLGHASLNSTQIYAEISQNTADKHLKEWGEKWFRTEPIEMDRDKQNRIPEFLNV